MKHNKNFSGYCKIEGCKRVVAYKKYKLCSMHGIRFVRYGRTNSPRTESFFTPKFHKSLGYYRLVLPNGKRVRYHRYLMEQHLGRPLTKQEHVHHINGDKTDNRIENLEIVSNSYHIKKYHGLHDPVFDWSIYKIPIGNDRERNKWKEKICMVNACNCPVEIRGLCQKHYSSFMNCAKGS